MYAIHENVHAVIYMATTIAPTADPMKRVSKLFNIVQCSLDII